MANDVSLMLGQGLLAAGAVEKLYTLHSNTARLSSAAVYSRHLEAVLATLQTCVSGQGHGP